MRAKLVLLATIAVLLVCRPLPAKVDLVTLPKRDAVQLTIYNAADLTLVMETRSLTLKAGLNRLQFSWANTLIDPTSLEMLPGAHAGDLDIVDLAFPPRMQNLGLWQVQSRFSGDVPVEITYLTSGLTWRAFYMGTLSHDEKTMRLQGYVRVTNNSGEDYENAKVRMIVGKINLIDAIVNLARREHPYGRPGPPPGVLRKETDAKAPRIAEEKQVFMRAAEVMEGKPKAIKKEGLSEYFLYTIEGTETIPHGWSKRMPSFEVQEIPVTNLYKYEEERYGEQASRSLSFKNDKQHKLGDTPIPGGIMKVYRNVGDGTHLSYEGQSRFKYIPVEKEVELDLGLVDTVIVKPTLMGFKTDKYRFDPKGNISGWDEIQEYAVEVKNTRQIPIQVVIKRNFKTPSWNILNTGDFGTYEKVDLDTVQFRLALRARETKKFQYVLTAHHGERANEN